MENPGVLRLTVEEAVSGGFSTPRNGVLMKMFNLIDVGERAGSGIPKVWKAWRDEGWGTPELTERFESLERTSLILPVNGVPIKSTDNGVPIKADVQKSIILDFIKKNVEIKGSDLLRVLNVKEGRIKKLLQQLIVEGKIAALGANKNRTYRLRE
jgi:predicted HTH transcriptional regulator